MPKIIASVREQLLRAARRQVETNGYAKMTVRSVAAECGIAVGTVYNYFPSKDMMVASFIVEDWYPAFNALLTRDGDDARQYLRRVYDTLVAFEQKYQALFSDPEAERIYATSFSDRHVQLRDRFAALIEPYCPDGEGSAFTAQFIAEALLTWTREGKTFEEIFAVIGKLIAG